MTPLVAVVGRPNVGKSTLVNRIVGRRAAIVEERPGVTRDRVLYEADWRGRPFTLVDTGGLEPDPEGALAGKVASAALAAAAQADVVMLVVDAGTGLTPTDAAVATALRRVCRRVVVVANKVDGDRAGGASGEFFALGFGPPHPVSALHGRGVGDLLDFLTASFPEAPPPEGREPAVAIVGRPNVGKSTLFNRIAGSERSIVHEEPGTTRDAVDTLVRVGERVWRFVDTAGLRRAPRIGEATEYYSVVRTLRALERSDVALLVLDVTRELSRQDLRIADRIAELGRSALVVVNKVDAADASVRARRREELSRRLPHLAWAPLAEVSARTGRGTAALLDRLEPLLRARTLRVPTPVLNAVLHDLEAKMPIPRGGRVKYAVQAETAPPTIVLFGAGEIPMTWLRYLERGLRERFGFEGTPLRFVLRGRERRFTVTGRGQAGRRRAGQTT